MKTLPRKLLEGHAVRKLFKIERGRERLMRKEKNFKKPPSKASEFFVFFG
jgi:hypothetical protein